MNANNVGIAYSSAYIITLRAIIMLRSLGGAVDNVALSQLRSTQFDPKWSLPFL